MAEGDYTGKGIDESHSAKQDMTPDFLKSSESNPNKPSRNADAAPGQEGAATRAGEDEVSSDKPSQKEEEYKNSVKGKQEAAKAIAGGAAGISKFIAKNGLKGAFKKAGPIGGVIIAILLFMGVAFGGQANMLYGLVSRIGVFNPTDMANSSRARVHIRNIMMGKYTKGGAWGKLDEKIKNKLAAAGIEVEETADGRTNFKTETEAGEVKTVTGETLDHEIDTNNKFLTQYSDGTATVGNSVHTVHSEQGETLRKGFGIDSMSDLNDIGRKGDTYDNAKQEYDSLLEQKVPKGGAMAEYESSKTNSDTDDDGTPRPPTNTDGDVEAAKVDDAEVGRIELDENVDEGKLADDIIAAVDGKAEVENGGKVGSSGAVDAASTGTKVANGFCQAYNVISSISRAVKVYELAQVLVVGYKIFQAIQRMQAGDGGADVLVDVVGTYLVTEATKKIVFSSKAGDFTTVTGSVMSSTPVASLFGGARLTQGDPIVRSFLTTDNDFRNFFDGISNSPTGYRSCIGVQFSAAIADLISDGVAVFTLGISEIAKFAIKIAISAAVTTAITLAVSYLVPRIIAANVRKWTDLNIGPGGSMTVFWMSSYSQERLGQSMGFRPATQETWVKAAVERRKYLSELARYDRETKSPFDITSEYTFLGSIMSNINTMSLNTNTIFGKVGNILSVTGKSFLTLTPASYADDAVDEMVSEGPCALNDINGLDPEDKMYCNAMEVPWNVPDYSTMGTSVEDVMWYWEKHTNHMKGGKALTGTVGSFETPYDPVDNPNPKVKQYTDLYFHIVEYAWRQAELNMPDSEIEASCANATTGSGVGDGLLGVTPFIGGLIDLYNSTEKQLCVDRIIGNEYTNMDDPGQKLESDMAERYIQDQDLGVAFGAYKESQTMAVMNDYYKEHPLDTSLYGTMARLSGMTKDEVAEAFQYIDTYTFIAQYDPSGYGPTIVTEPEQPKIYIEDTDGYPVLATIIYNQNYYYRKDQYITA